MLEKREGCNAIRLVLVCGKILAHPAMERKVEKLLSRDLSFAWLVAIANVIYGGWNTDSPNSI